jgi:hypothetical protein
MCRSSIALESARGATYAWLARHHEGGSNPLRDQGRLDCRSCPVTGGTGLRRMHVCGSPRGKGTGPVSAKDRKKVLWCPYAQKGSIYPVVPVIQALEIAGVDVTLLGPRSLGALAARLGLSFRPYVGGIQFDWSKREGVDPRSYLPSSERAWFHERVRAEYDEIAAAFARIRVDIRPFVPSPIGRHEPLQVPFPDGPFGRRASKDLRMWRQRSDPGHLLDNTERWDDTTRVV